MTGRVLLSVTITSLTLLIILLLVTSPQQVGPAGIFGVFILGYVSLAGLVTFLLYFGGRYTKRIIARIRRRQVVGELALGRSYVYGLALAMLPMIFVSFYAAGSISWYDIVLLVLFGVISLFYVARRA